MTTDITVAARISIHALREEGDQVVQSASTRRRLFLSTPSARRATGRWQSVISPFTYFYPRPPRGGRPTTAKLVLCGGRISIHALREEGDPHWRQRRELFQ